MEDEGSNLHRKRSKPTMDSQFSSTSMQESYLKNPTLSQDLITEILSRLPVKTLVRFRCVSKSWLSLISSPAFVKIHLSLSVNNKEHTHHTVMWNIGNELNLRDCSLTSLFDVESLTDVFHLDYPIMISDELYKDLIMKKMRIADELYKHLHIKKMMILGSVDGLICLAVNYTTDLFLWNRSNRVYKKLPDPISPFGFSEDYIYGFGYDKIHDDYKVVATFYDPNPAPSKEPEEKIYSLKSDSWKTLDGFPNQDVFQPLGTFVNRKIHWPTSPINANADDNLNAYDQILTITSFDLATEKWGVVEHTTFCEAGEDTEFVIGGVVHKEFVVRWMGVLGSHLVVFYDRGENYVDVWIMKEYGVKDSWTKEFIIRYADEDADDNLHQFSLPSFLSNTGEMLVVLGSSFMIYNTKENLLRLSEGMGFDDSPNATIYVESLVCPLMQQKQRHKDNQVTNDLLLC